MTRSILRLSARHFSILLVIALAGCAADQTKPEAPLPPGALRPISKVTVENKTADWRYVRLNWPDGGVQVFRVEPGDLQYLSGAIGTSGFPSTIMVLDAQCGRLAAVNGLAPGTAGLLTIADSGARLEPITVGGLWHVADSIQACGAHL